MKLKFLVVLLLAVGGLASCKTSDETIGSVLGGAVGAGTGFGLSKAFGGDSTVTALATAGGAVAGVLIGSEIARYLDEQDQKKAEDASAKAITAGEPGQVARWKSDKNPGVHGATKVVDTGTVQKDRGSSKIVWGPPPTPRKREPDTTRRTAAPARQATPPTTTRPARTASTPEPAVSKPASTSTPDDQVAANTSDDARTCKKISEVAYIQGKEHRQERVFCQTANGGWAPVAA